MFVSDTASPSLACNATAGAYRSVRYCGIVRPANAPVPTARCRYSPRSTSSSCGGGPAAQPPPASPATPRPRRAGNACCSGRCRGCTSAPPARPVPPGHTPAQGRGARGRCGARHRHVVGLLLVTDPAPLQRRVSTSSSDALTRSCSAIATLTRRSSSGSACSRPARVNASWTALTCPIAASRRTFRARARPPALIYTGKYQQVRAMHSGDRPRTRARSHRRAGTVPRIRRVSRRPSTTGAHEDPMLLVVIGHTAPRCALPGACRAHGPTVYRRQADSRSGFVRSANVPIVSTKISTPDPRFHRSDALLSCAPKGDSNP
jgi:hypothetical protein